MPLINTLCRICGAAEWVTGGVCMHCAISWHEKTEDKMADVQWYKDGDVQFAIVGRYIAVVKKWRSLFGDPDDPEQWEASHYLIRSQLDTNLLEIVQDGGAICASEAEAKETALDVAGYYTTQDKEQTP